MAISQIVQNSVSTGVAGTGPAFSAYLNTAQSISANTWTKVQLNTEDFDTNNNFDSTTNYRFTPTVAGYYLISGQATTAGGAYFNSGFCAIYKNGSIYRTSAISLSGAYINYAYPSVSAVIYFNGTTDYVELYAKTSLSTSPNIYSTDGNGTVTYLSGSLVRSA